MSPDDLKNEPGKILVTGGNGFIGSHLASRLHEMGCDVRIADIVRESSFTTPIANEVFIGDLCDPVFCQKAIQGVSRVLHFAAVMGGMGTIHAGNDMPIYMKNHAMTTNLLNASRDTAVKHFFFASSACVYPSHLQSSAKGDVSLRESDVWAQPPPSPQGLYGLEKLASEQLLRLGSGSMQVQIARFHNVYGPRGAWCNGREKVPAALLRKTIAAKLSGQSQVEIEIWGSGAQRRSFLYIDDCVDAPPNIGSDEGISVDKLAELAIGIAGLDPAHVTYVHQTDMPVGVAARNSNNNLIARELDWRPKTSLKVGMTATAGWIKGEIQTLFDSTLAARRLEMLKALMRSRKVDIVPGSTQKYGILLPITSRGLHQPGDCLKKLQVFAKSLVDTTWRDTLTVSGDFRIHIYLAVDHDDEYLLDGAKAEAVLRDAGLTAITTILCDHPRGHVCALWRDCARQAWKDGCDWMTLMGDDVELLDEGWMRRVREEFEAISLKEGVPGGFGCVAFTDDSFPGMPTFPIVHRSHLGVFGGEVIPDTFINQDGDPYLYQLYHLLLKYGARPDVRIRINTRNLGASESRNRGLRESSAEWAQFLDDDVEPDAALLHNAERYIRQHPDAAGFVGTTLFPCADSVATAAIHLAGVTYFWDIAQKFQDHTDLPWGVTANLIARRNINDGVFYDPIFPKTGGGEDIDFCLKKRQGRMRQGGGGFHAAPDVIVTHPWWNNGKRSYWRFYMWAKGDGALVKLYPEYTYRDFAPNSAECLLTCGILLLLTTCYGLLTFEWTYTRLAVTASICLPVANLLHDLYRHLWRDAERTQGINTTVAGLGWPSAVMESTLIRMASETGRVVGMLKRGEYQYLRQRFDWFVGRFGVGPKEEERKNSLQKFGLWILFIAAAYR
ncbi:hypothetical protein FRB98_007345 [Tulasnella sp. 332]|nr:hypothetical protein FRB98_007345 [Tulasnella sp. 332]